VADLRTDGFTLIRGALKPASVERLTDALDRVHRDERSDPREPMHLLGGIGRDDAFLELLDHPAVFPLVWRELGWNIHVYHCHLDVTPPCAAPHDPAVWGWHQDGGRQNVELETDPRARLSLKVAYWLSDVSEPGRGNILVIPGSHTRNTLPRQEPPRGAMPVLASPGDAMVFDRRLWHSRSDNLSAHTRRAIFLAYTYRWIRPRDDLGIDPSESRFQQLSPVRRQLLGEGSEPRSYWGLGRDQPVPLQRLSALAQRKRQREVQQHERAEGDREALTAGGGEGRDPGAEQQQLERQPQWIGHPDGGLRRDEDAPDHGDDERRADAEDPLHRPVVGVEAPVGD
jgi:hypothetical protein